MSERTNVADEPVVVERPKVTPDKRLRAAGVRHWVAVRAVERGLTDEDIEWNKRLGRPLAFIETVDPKAEEGRRAAWSQLDDLRKEVENAG
jgi:hypothetical protein